VRLHNFIKALPESGIVRERGAEQVIVIDGIDDRLALAPLDQMVVDYSLDEINEAFARSGRRARHPARRS
jgi:threonine dehydrogenase-like Zn-dependent dehydrogenase